MPSHCTQEGRIETAVTSERATIASISCSPNSFASAYGSCGRSSVDSSSGALVAWKRRSANAIPVTVSLETFTTRSTPIRTAASATLNVAIRLLRNTVAGELRVGSGSAAQWMTASAPRTTAKASPASVKSACT